MFFIVKLEAPPHNNDIRKCFHTKIPQLTPLKSEIFLQNFPIKKFEMFHWAIAVVLLIASVDAQNNTPYISVLCEKGIAVNWFGDHYCKLSYKPLTIPRCSAGRLYDESAKKCRLRRVVKEDGSCSYPLDVTLRKMVDVATKKTWCVHFNEPIGTREVCKDLVTRPDEEGFCYEKTYKGVSTVWRCDDWKREPKWVNGKHICVPKTTTLLEYEDDISEEVETLQKNCIRFTNKKRVYIC